MMPGQAESMSTLSISFDRSRCGDLCCIPAPRPMSACPSRPGPRPISRCACWTSSRSRPTPARRDRAGATLAAALPDDFLRRVDRYTKEVWINLLGLPYDHPDGRTGAGLLETVRSLPGRGPALRLRLLPAGLPARDAARRHGRRDRRRPGGPARVPPDVVPRDGSVARRAAAPAQRARGGDPGRIRGPRRGVAGARLRRTRGGPPGADGGRRRWLLRASAEGERSRRSSSGRCPA